MRFVIYARKSTESEDRQVQSLDDQLGALQDLARRENLHVSEVFVESKSAKAPGQRPVFDHMVEGIEKGEIEGILTWSINRLSRNPVDGGRIAYLLQTRKLSVIRTVERTYLPDDNALLLSIENGMATAYLQDLSRNVLRGMHGKLDRGWVPGRVPLGYKNDAETREIVPDSERFDLVRQAWHLLLGGDHDLSEVIEFLRQENLTVYSRRRGPKPVGRATLYKTFRNPFYCGRATWNGRVCQGSHQAMITEKQFEQVQCRLNQSSHHCSTRADDFMFRGLLRCEACGCLAVRKRMTKTFSQTNRTIEYTYYHCSGAKGCPKSGIRHDDLVRTLTAQASEVAISATFAAWVRKNCAQILEREFSTTADPDPSEQQLQAEETKLDNLVTMRAAGEIGPEEFARNRASILSRISDLRRGVTRTAHRPVQILERLEHCLATARRAEKLDDKSLMELAEFVRNVGGALFKPGTVTLKLHPALQKIAALEPAVASSQTAFSGVCSQGIPVWWTELEEILNLIARTEMQ